jgi:hypothetical protein
MSAIALSNTIALLPGWSASGCGDARAIKHRTPRSLPPSWLSRTAIGVATGPSTLPHSRDRQRLGPDPITATRTVAAKSP